MTDFIIGDEEYVEEVNTSYDQDQLIGDSPQAYYAVGAEPINAQNGQNFFNRERLLESLNKDGTGIAKATRGIDPKKTKRKYLRFVYVSKSECAICKAFDGKVYHIDDEDRPCIPRLEEWDGFHPVTHPNCKCKWVKTFSDEDFGHESLALEYNDAHQPSGSSKGGQFAPKGNHSSKQITSSRQNSFVSDLTEKYPDLSAEFFSNQLNKAEKIYAQTTQSVENFKMSLKSKFPHVKIEGRAKEPKSMVDKLGRKREYGDVNDLNDLIGGRLICNNINEVNYIVSRLKEDYQITDEEDRITQDNGGYRSYHMTLLIDGFPSEIQVRTQNQHKWANYCHDNFYKPMNEEMRNFIKVNKDTINNYITDMSDYYYKLDTGYDMQRPDCPEIVAQKVGCL